MRRFLAASGITSFGVLLGIFAASQLAKNAPLRRDKLTFAYAKIPALALYFIAEDQGYFVEEGLELSAVPFATGREALAFAMAGNADLASVYQTPFLLEALSGKQVEAISALHTSSQGTGIVAMRSRGIRSPADLEGKRVAFVEGTNAEFFAVLFFQNLGIPLRKDRKVSSSLPYISTILQDGKADAISIWEPELSKLENSLGEDAIVFHSDVYIEMCLLAGQPVTLSQKRSALAKLLRGLHRAEAFLQNHLDTSLRIGGRALPHTPLETLRKTWETMHFAVGVDNLLFMTLEQEIDLLNRLKPANGKPLVASRLINASFLEESVPEAVTWLHNFGEVTDFK